MKHIVLFITAIVLCGCTQKTKIVVVPDNDFLSGEFVYFADAATFTDCATGVVFPVSQTKAYIRIERSYLMLTPTPAEPLYVEFRGRVVEEPAMEGDDSVQTVVIDSLIGFKKNERCLNNMLLAGVYECINNDRKEIVRLKSDYTYTGEIFDDGSHREVSGTWARSAMEELILIQKLPVEDATAFEIIPAQESFTDNSGGDPRVFTKVHL